NHVSAQLSSSSFRLSSAFSAMMRSMSLVLGGGAVSGRDDVPVRAIASANRRYVSTDATTMRASTLTRSIPTSDTRTYASMTMPLSSTRSRTSMRLLPAAALSTAISLLRRGGALDLLLLDAVQLARQPVQFRAQRCDLDVLDGGRRVVRIRPPPVHADLLRLVDRTDEQADSDGQQFDIGEV